MNGGGVRTGESFSDGEATRVGGVLLRGVPVRLLLRLGHHVDELSRELEILGAGGNPRASPAGELLRPAFQHLLELSNGHRRSALERAEAAADEGVERFDLELRLPRAAVAVTHELVAVLEEADELSRGGELLTMAPSDEVVALRRWIAAEIEAQLVGGDAPRPCPL
ncbi:MAG: hypothetical protein M3Q48_06140 [Actinomycetota bacterium]|nr:hypothetical protein [Actinomycetota bacterium]